MVLSPGGGRVKLIFIEYHHVGEGPGGCPPPGKSILGILG